MRDFNFKDDSNAGAIARPLETPPEAVVLSEPVLDETPREDSSSLRSFHVETDEEESNNLPKIVGAAVVGLLIVGGGLYAYETTFAHQAPVKTVAMNTTAAPANMPAATPPVSTPDTSAAPPAATPAPAAPVKSASAMPEPRSEPLKSEPEQSASNAPSNAPGVGIGPTNDPAINAPMTLTPETAPPPQGSSSQTAAASPSAATTPAQTAMQQPITAPDVGNSAQPTASVAANQASGVSVPSDTAPASQPAQIQPAQIQPAPIQPSPVQ